MENKIKKRLKKVEKEIDKYIEENDPEEKWLKIGMGFHSSAYSDAQSSFRVGLERLKGKKEVLEELIIDYAKGKQGEVKNG